MDAEAEQSAREVMPLMPLVRVHENRTRRFSRAQAAVFAISFSSYASMHLGRKAYSAIKPMLGEQHVFVSTMPTDQIFGLMDASFLLLYSIGLFASGALADRHDLRVVISVGLVLSGLFTSLFGLGGLLGVRSPVFYASVWSLNGLVQSSGWPANIALMGTWFVGARGAVFGAYQGCVSVGNIAGTLLVLATLGARGDHGGGWAVAMLVAGTIMLVQGVVVRIWLPRGSPPHAAEQVEEPRDERGSLEELGGRDELSAELGAPSDAPHPSGAGAQMGPVGAGGGDGMDGPKGGGGKRAVSFVHALRLPGVLPYSLCYACLKGVDYAFFFWVPRYLQSAANLSSAHADWVSMLYDVGQMCGSVLAGAATDGSSSRAPVTVGMLLASAPVIWLTPGHGYVGTLCMLFVLGLVLGGPVNLVSGCIAADLGQHPKLRGKEKALATVTGIIDGCGSFGAALAQYVVGVLAPRGECGKAGCDWSRVFAFLIVTDLIAAACLAPVLRPIVRDRFRSSGSSAVAKAS